MHSPQNQFVTTSSPTFETSQIILSSDYKILQFDDNLSHRLDAEKDNIKGQYFRDILVSINENWDDILPQNLQTLGCHIFLPWAKKNQSIISGFTLHLLRHEETIFVTMSPSLAPETDFHNISFSDFNTQPIESSQIFLRLKSAENRLENYIKHFPGIFFSQRPDFSFNYIAPQFEEKFSLSPKLLYKSGSRFLRLFLEPDRNTFISELKKNTAEPKPFTLNYRLRNPETDTVVYILDARVPVISPTGLLLGYEGVWMDITRQAIAEDKLTKSSWKESLSIITNGLIHDFSNIMAGIYSISEMYTASIDPSNEWHEGIEQIKKNSKDAQKLVRRIMDLSREVSQENNYYDARKLIEDQLDLIKMVLPKKTKINFSLGKQELPLYIDDVGFRQMLLNFATNASDALKENPNINITCNLIKANTSTFKNTINGEFIAPKDGALITFSDNGSGIDPHIQSKIFDPFFTTKDTTKGSGFGLYNIKLFLDKYDGHIDINSSPNNGTTFYIYIPLTNFDETDEIINTPNPYFHPSVIIYSPNESVSSNIIELMKGLEWRIHIFSTKETLQAYLNSEPKFDLSYLFNIGRDKDIPDILQLIKENNPSSKCIIQTIGENADEVDSFLVKLTDLSFANEISNQEILKKIKTILT